MNILQGDWYCRSCQHLNFTLRPSCQRCGELKPSDSSGRGGSSSELIGPNVKPGDWSCSCGVNNFASRSSCFKCGALKDSSGRRAGWKSGDWICNRFGCNEHNFASRMECFRCNSPRDFGDHQSSYYS